MRRQTILAAVAVAAPVLAGCGGSSSSRSTSTTSSATDQSTAAAVASSRGGNSTRLDSPAYRKLITMAVSEKGLSPPIAGKVADCVIKKETAQGYKTVADVARDATTRRQAIRDGAECTTQALPAG
jgi:hypothetical protein